MKRVSYRTNDNIRTIQLVLVGLTLIFAWIISGWNTYNADLHNYEIMYSLAEFDNPADSNYGIYFLFEILKKLNLDFFYSRLILYGIFYSVLAYVLLKTCKNAFIASVLYLGYQLVRDTVEMKNYMALITMTVSIYVLSFQTLKHRIYSFVLILIAGSFHIAYYAFLLMPFISFQKKLPLYRSLLCYVIVAFFSRLIVGSVLSIYTTSFIDNRVEDYMSYSGYGAFFASLLVVCGCVFVFYLTFKKTESITNYNSIVINGISYRQYSLFMYNINVLGASLLVLASITFSFICRLYSLIILFNIIYCLNYFHYRRKAVFDIIVIIFVVFYLAVLIFLTMSKGHYDDVFNNNLILTYNENVI